MTDFFAASLISSLFCGFLNLFCCIFSLIEFDALKTKHCDFSIEYELGVDLSMQSTVLTAMIVKKHVRHTAEY